MIVNVFWLTSPLIVLAAGAPSSAATLIVYFHSFGPSSPSGTTISFVTGNDTVVGSTSYVFVNVTGLSTVSSASKLRVPSPLSVTTTVTVLDAVASFVTPGTVPDSSTVYVYVPGYSYLIAPNSYKPSEISYSLELVIDVSSGRGAFVGETAVIVNVNSPSISGGVKSSSASRIFLTGGSYSTGSTL